MEVNFILNLKSSREVVGDTVKPRFFEQAIIRIPQFFELFPWSLGFAVRNPINYPRFFELRFFELPNFSNHIIGPFE